MSARPAAVNVPMARRQSIVVTRPRHYVGQWTLFLILVIVAFFGLIGSRVSLDGSAFELNNLQEQIAVQESRQSMLQLDLARLQDPGRVAAAADRMGLEYPEARKDLSVAQVDKRLTDIDHRWEAIDGGLRAQP